MVGANTQAMARKSRPFLMRGEAVPNRPRARIGEAPDPRVPTVRPGALPADELRLRLRGGPIDPFLRGVDRHLQRWAVTPGSTISIPRLAQVRYVYGRGDRPLPLGDRDCQLIDHAVRTSPEWVRQLLHLWYRTDRPAQEIAQIFGSPRRQTAYERLNLVLAYLLGRLSQMGLASIATEPGA